MSPPPATGPFTGGLSTGFGGVPRMQRWNSAPLSLSQGLLITTGGRGSGLISGTQVLPSLIVPGRHGSANRHAPSSNRVPGGHVGFTTITGGLLSTLGGTGSGRGGSGGIGRIGLLIGNGSGATGFGQFW